jgi:hypothetical protein
VILAAKGENLSDNPGENKTFFEKPIAFLQKV